MYVPNEALLTKACISVTSNSETRSDCCLLFYIPYSITFGTIYHCIKSVSEQDKACIPFIIIQLLSNHHIICLLSKRHDVEISSISVSWQ